MASKKDLETKELKIRLSEIETGACSADLTSRQESSDHTRLLKRSDDRYKKTDEQTLTT